MADVFVARCACGALTARCDGPPARVSICHCHDCKRLSGSAFSWNARWPDGAVTVTGRTATHSRTGDEGSIIANGFCPDCGVTVTYTNSGMPGWIAIRAGCLAGDAFDAAADAGRFSAPSRSVYHDRCVAWLAVAETADRIG